MFDHGAEFPLLRGTPARDFNGRKVRGGVPCDVMAVVISADASQIGAVAVKTQPGNQLYIVELDDLTNAEDICDAFGDGVVPSPTSTTSSAPAELVKATPLPSRAEPAPASVEPWGPEPWGDKPADAATDLTDAEIDALARQAGVWWPSLWADLKRLFVLGCVVWTLLSWVYLWLT